MKKAKEINNTDNFSVPAMTPDAREKQMIALAVDSAEKMLREGNAPSQIITHYLKLGSSRERLELERLREENKLLRAKTEAIESSKDMDVDYKRVIAAIMEYKGLNIGSEGDEYGDY